MERLLEKRQGKIYVLVRENSRPRLDDLVERWSVAVGPSAADRIEPVIGDLRRPLLGVEKDQVAELRGKVNHFFHLAAVYDMTAPAERNTAVNVGGTTHAVELARADGRQASAPRLLDRRRRHLQGRLHRGDVRRGPAAALALPPHQVRVRADRPRPALHALARVPARDRRRRLPDRRDGKGRRPLLLLQGDPAHAPPAARSGSRSSGSTSATRTWSRSTGSRARSSRSPTSPTSTAAPSTSPTRARSAWTSC